MLVPPAARLAERLPDLATAVVGRHAHPHGTLDAAALDAATDDLFAAVASAGGPGTAPAAIDAPIGARVEAWHELRAAAQRLGIGESADLHPRLVDRVRTAYGVGQVDTAGRHADATAGGSDWITPLTPARHPLHESYVEASMRGVSPPHGGDGIATEVMVIGVPGAGKTTMLREMRGNIGLPADVLDNAVAVDADAAKAWLPEYRDLRLVGDQDAGRLVQRESALMADLLQRRAEARRLNVVAQRSGRNSTDLGELVDVKMRGGYDTALLVSDVSTGVAIQRSARRALVTGRHVDPGLIASSTQTVASNALAALRSPGGIDEVRILDTERAGDLVAQRTRAGVMRVPDMQRFRAVATRAGVDDADAWLERTEGALAHWRANPGTVMLDGEQPTGLRFLEMSAHALAGPLDARHAAHGRLYARSMPADFAVVTRGGVEQARRGDLVVQNDAGVAWPMAREQLAPLRS